MKQYLFGGMIGFILSMVIWSGLGWLAWIAFVLVFGILYLHSHVHIEEDRYGESHFRWKGLDDE